MNFLVILILLSGGVLILASLPPPPEVPVEQDDDMFIEPPPEHDDDAARKERLRVLVSPLYWLQQSTYSLLPSWLRWSQTTMNPLIRKTKTTLSTTLLPPIPRESRTTETTPTTTTRHRHPAKKFSKVITSKVVTSSSKPVEEIEDYGDYWW